MRSNFLRSTLLVYALIAGTVGIATAYAASPNYIEAFSISADALVLPVSTVDTPAFALAPVPANGIARSTLCGLMPVASYVATIASSANHRAGIGGARLGPSEPVAYNLT